MRHSLMAFGLALAAMPALAQDAPKRVKTEIIRESAPGMSFLYSIDEDDTVRIDWMQQNAG